MIQEQVTVRCHPWEKAGLGRAPYKFLGVSKNLYDMGGGQSKPGGSCDYCGQGILYEFHCRSSDDRRFKVGCDCIARVHAPAEKIVEETKKALREFKAKAVRAKREVGRKAEREAKAAAEAARVEGIKVALQTDPLYARLGAARDALEASNRESGFVGEMRKAMERWGALTDAQEAAVLRVLGRIEGEPARKAASFHLGALGERVTIAGVVEQSRCIYQGVGFGDRSRYLTKIRTDAGAAVVWFGGYALDNGVRVEGGATIKKLDNYQGEAQTTITNPRWKS